MEVSTVVYWIDSEGRFLPNGDQPSPMGDDRTTVLDCMSSETLRDLWIGVFRRALRVGEVALVCRCDSPGVHRQISIRVTRRGEDQLQVISRVLDSHTRPDAVSQRIRADRGLMLMCSWCNKVRTPGGWIEVEAAIQDQSYLGAKGGGTHGVCPDCKQTLLDVVAGH